MTTALDRCWMTRPYRAGDAGFLEGAADLFESWPWWVLLPMCALFLGIIYTLMIQRGLNKREWTVPSQSQIVLVQGKLDDDRVGVKGPYRLNVGSRIIRLYCEPYVGTWQSCLEAKESYDHLSSRPVQVSYFLAKTDWGAKIAVLMNVSSGGNLFSPSMSSVNGCWILPRKKTATRQFLRS